MKKQQDAMPHNTNFQWPDFTMLHNLSRAESLALINKMMVQIDEASSKASLEAAKLQAQKEAEAAIIQAKKEAEQAIIQAQKEDEQAIKEMEAERKAKEAEREARLKLENNNKELAKFLLSTTQNSVEQIATRLLLDIEEVMQIKNSLEKEHKDLRQKS